MLIFYVASAAFVLGGMVVFASGTSSKKRRYY